MIPQLYEIHETQIKYGMASYPRPCVIIGQLIRGRVSVVAISSAMDLYRGPPIHFLLSPDDPKFGKTGLEKESFVTSSPIEEVDSSKLLKKRGQLEGELLKRFIQWI